MDIGSRLRAERERLGMTQDVFGQIGGVLKRALIRYEKGERVPDAEFLAAIAAAGADVLYILTGQRNPAMPAPNPALTRRQAALLDNYDHLTETDKTALERHAFALSEQKNITKGKVA